MRILQINPLPGNPIPLYYEAQLAARHHMIETYRPSTAGAGRPLPIKALLVPRRLLSMEQAVGKMSKRHFDVAHIHWASYSPLGLGSRIPYVIHCHGSDVRHRLRKPLYRAALGPGLDKAAAVFYATPDLAEPVRQARPDAIFMPVPIDVTRFTPEVTRPPRPFTIMLFGRLEAGKGSRLAMEGIMRFAVRRSDISVITMDWGKLAGELKQQYGRRVEFLPRTTPDKMSEIVSHADVVVGQFVIGALGLSEFEAMSCAKPVIASYRYHGIYNESPPVCDAATAEDIDAWLEHLYQHPAETMAIGKQSREWVRKHHDGEAQIDLLERIYASITK